MQIHLKNLRFMAIIGVHAWEQATARQFTMQVTLDYDASKAAATDDLAYAVDYAAVEARVVQLAASRHWQLIETLAEAAATCLLAEFPPLTRVTISIEKPQAMLQSDLVSVTTMQQRK